MQKLNPIKPRTKVRKNKRKFRKMAKTNQKYRIIDEHVAHIEELLLELSKELEFVEPAYGGGEEWDPEEGYLFTADSISPLRERLAQRVRPADEADPSPLHQKDLSGCVAVSRIRHQTEWVLKKKIPATDKHVMFCISFCDGAIPEPPNPYNDPPTVHLDI